MSHLSLPAPSATPVNTLPTSLSRTWMPKLALVFLGMFLYVEVVEAGFLRSGGRSSQTDTAPQTYYLVDEQYMLDISGSIGIDAYQIDEMFANSPSFGFTSGTVFMTSALGCVEEIQFDETDGVPEEFLPVYDGCSYEYTKDENIVAVGDFYAYIPGASSYDVVWTVSNGTQTWLFNDSVQAYVQQEDDTPLVLDYEEESYYKGGNLRYQDSGQLTTSPTNIILNAAVPDDMLPGIYRISVSVTMQASDTQHWFYNRDDRAPMNPDCDNFGTPEEYCIWTGMDYEGQSLTFSAYSAETLIIRPVSAPLTFSLLCLAVGWVSCRRRLTMN